MRAIVAALTAVVLVAAGCSNGDERGHPYAAQTAVLGESLAVLGWNMSVSNLRFDADYVLVDVDASPSQQGAPHAKPEDIRFGLYGALAHPIEANAIGGCRDVTSLAVQPLSAPTPDRLTGTVCLGPQRDIPDPGSGRLRVLRRATGSQAPRSPIPRRSLSGVPATNPNDTGLTAQYDERGCVPRRRHPTRADRAWRSCGVQRQWLHAARTRNQRSGSAIP